MNRRIACAFSILLAFAFVSSPPAAGQVEDSFLLNNHEASLNQWFDLRASAPGDSPGITVLESNGMKTVLEVVLPGFWMTFREIENQEYRELSIPGHTTTTEIGKPAVPVIHVLVAIPPDASIETSWITNEEVALKNCRIFPFQPPLTDNQNQPSDIVLDQIAYQSSEPYPMSAAKVDEPAVWRHLRVVTLQIRPLEYLADQDLLVIKPRMTVELCYTPGSDGSGMEVDTGAVRPHWETMYEKNVINFNWLQLESQNELTPAGTVYLIVTHPSFASAVEPLAEWHHKEGMRTEVLSISTTDPQVIKDEIATRYNDGDLEFVLLVGDTNYMPVYNWSDFTGTYASDYWYSCITGSPDLFADLAIGRLSVYNTGQVENQVNKILKYEQDPPRDSWVNNILLVAHKENAPGKYVGCKETIRNDIIPQPPYVVDTAYGHELNGLNTTVRAAIDEGRIIVNYRGHGSSGSWSSWNYKKSSWKLNNINNLTNGDRTPVVFNIACLNHKIQSTCLGEHWMSKYPGGAVASLGATGSSYTSYNHTYDKKLFQAFCQDGQHRIGWISNQAASVIANQGAYGKANAKMYLWLGDPATEIWSDIPEPLVVAHPKTVMTGARTLEIKTFCNSLPIEDVTVCFMRDQGEELYVVEPTGPDGIATLDQVFSSTGTVYVTASKHNCVPYQGEIQIVRAQDLYCDVQTVMEHDGAKVDFALDAGWENAGRTYMLLGSVSGTSPGTVLPGGLVTIPLNRDWFTRLIIENAVIGSAEKAFFLNFKGTLDHEGRSWARLNLPPMHRLAGTTLYFSFTCMHPFDYVSNAVEIKVIE